MQGNWFKRSLIPWDYPNVYRQRVYYCFWNGLEKRRQNPLPARVSPWVTDLKSWTSYPLQINRTTSKTHADQISNLACKCSYISWDSLWPISRKGACEWLQRCWKNCLAKHRIQVLWKSLTLGWRRTTERPYETDNLYSLTRELKIIIWRIPNYTTCSASRCTLQS